MDIFFIFSVGVCTALDCGAVVPDTTARACGDGCLYYEEQGKSPVCVSSCPSAFHFNNSLIFSFGILLFLLFCYIFLISRWAVRV